MQISSLFKVSLLLFTVSLSAPNEVTLTPVLLPNSILLVMNATLAQILDEITTSKELGGKDFMPVLASSLVVIVTIIGYFITKRIARKLREFERNKIELTRRQMDQKDREIAMTERKQQLDLLLETAKDPCQKSDSFAQIAELFPMYADFLITKTRNIKVRIFNRSGFLGKLVVPSTTNHPSLYFSDLPRVIEPNSSVNFTFKVAIDYPKDQQANGALVYNFGSPDFEVGASKDHVDAILGTKILFGISSQPGNENLCCVQASEERLEDFIEKVRRKITSLESDDDIDLGVGNLEWSQISDNAWGLNIEKTIEMDRFKVKARMQSEPSQSCEFKVKKLITAPIAAVQNALIDEASSHAVIASSLANITAEESPALLEFPLSLNTAEGAPCQTGNVPESVSVEIMPNFKDEIIATTDSLGHVVS